MYPLPHKTVSLKIYELTTFQFTEAKKLSNWATVKQLVLNNQDAPLHSLMLCSFHSATVDLGGLPCCSVVKNLPANSGDADLIPGREDPLEKETATHSSILAWETPWTEESGLLQSMGSRRVGHNLATKQQQWTYMRRRTRGQTVRLTELNMLLSFCFALFGFS